jgi:hypothetical protein
VVWRFQKPLLSSVRFFSRGNFRPLFQASCATSQANKRCQIWHLSYVHLPHDSLANTFARIQTWSPRRAIYVVYKVNICFLLARSSPCLPPAGFVIGQRVPGRLLDSPIFQTKNAIRFGRIIDHQVLCSLARTSDADRQGGREPWWWTQVIGGID